MSETLNKFDIESLSDIYSITDYYEQSAIFEIIDTDNTLTEQEKDDMGMVTVIIVSGHKAKDVQEALDPVKKKWAAAGELEWAMPDHEGPTSIN